MNIKLEQTKRGWWRADCTDLPGSPPCGDGQTREMAIANLLYRLIGFDTDCKSTINGTLTIDGEPWRIDYR